jgi:hypothetical protein
MLISRLTLSYASSGLRERLVPVSVKEGQVEEFVTPPREPDERSTSKSKQTKLFWT